MKSLAVALALPLFLGGCFQIAILGELGGASSSGSSTGTATGTGTSTGGSTSGGATSSGTGTGTGGGVCGPCAAGATCDGGVCVCSSGDPCPQGSTEARLFCDGKCVSCFNGQLVGDAGAACLRNLAFSLKSSTGCIAVNDGGVYFNSGQTIQMVPLTSGVPTRLWAGLDTTGCLAIDSSSIYFTVQGQGAVVKILLDGGDLTVLAQGQNDPYGIAVDDNNIYWTNKSGNQVMQADKGDGANRIVLADLNDAGTNTAPYGIAVDRHNVYWTNYNLGNVMMVPIGGGNRVILSGGHRFPFWIAVNNTAVYWTSQFDGTVYRFVLDGGYDGGDLLYRDPRSSASGIALDDKNVYWTNQGSNGSIYFESLDGGGPTPLTNGAEVVTPYQIAVDSNNVYWTSQSTTPGAVFELTPK